MFRYLSIVVALGIILAAGLFQGLRTDRWSKAYDFTTSADALAAIPLQIGDWKGEDEGFDAHQYSHAGIRCGVVRRYRNENTGRTVSLMIVGGPPGPISVHQPETCYASAGYEVIGTRTTYRVPGRPEADPADFWVARFHQGTRAIVQDLVIHYGWSHDGRWQAPEGDARLAFASVPALLKLYVVQEVLRGSERDKEQPGEVFLQEVLPTVTKTLFSGNTLVDSKH